MKKIKESSNLRSAQLVVKFKVVQETKISDPARVSSLTTILELKDLAELQTGIPTEIQRLHYLDRGELLETGIVRDYDVISGAIFTVDVWREWEELLSAILLDDIYEVFRLGVTADSSFNPPHIDYMSTEDRQEVFRQRAFLALYISAHRGQQNLCQKLLNSGIDVNQKTSSGRCPLHIAAVSGQEKILECLLEAGADIHMKDRNGLTAVQLCKLYGHKSCEQLLTRFAFNLRAAKSHVSEFPMFAHQYFDSALKPYLQHTHAQIYLQQLLPPGEYEGTYLNSPKRTVKLPKGRPSSNTEKPSRKCKSR